MNMMGNVPFLAGPEEDDYDDDNIPEIDLPRQSDTTFVSPDRIFTEDDDSEI